MYLRSWFDISGEVFILTRIIVVDTEHHRCPETPALANVNLAVCAWDKESH